MKERKLEGGNEYVLIVFKCFVIKIYCFKEKNVILKIIQN